MSRSVWLRGQRFSTTHGWGRCVPSFTPNMLPLLANLHNLHFCATRRANQQEEENKARTSQHSKSLNASHSARVPPARGQVSFLTLTHRMFAMFVQTVTSHRSSRIWRRRHRMSSSFGRWACNKMAHYRHQLVSESESALLEIDRYMKINVLCSWK